MKRFDSVFQRPHISSFMSGMLIFGVAVGMYTGVLNNYLHEVLSISRLERGIIEFPRELPGLLLIVIFGFLYRMSESRLIQAAFFVSFVGTLGLSIFGDHRILAVLMIVLWSTGEHMIMPVRRSIAIHGAKQGKEGLAMGMVAGVTNIGQVAGNYLVPLFLVLLPVFIAKQSAFTYFRIIFIVTAAVLLGGFLLLSRLSDLREHVKRRRLFFHRKYLKYYILEVFYGARKQVFLTFAPYVLILNYGAKTELVAALYGIWSVSNIVINPLLGKLLDKIGYKKIIVADTIVLIILCVLYGFSHHWFPRSTAFIVVCVVFVLDAMLFAVGMARAMYARSLSDSQEETTSTLATGLSINHLVSILIAVAGGVVWQALGVEAVFSMAAVFALGSFIFSLTLPRIRPSKTAEAG
jgi:predicted MFS family arabinose efflux permease